jgi:hypothetical protein
MIQYAAEVCRATEQPRAATTAAAYNSDDTVRANQPLNRPTAVSLNDDPTITSLKAPRLFSSHQAKASGKSSALASSESEGTEDRVNRIGILVVGGIDGADA